MRRALPEKSAWLLGIMLAWCLGTQNADGARCTAREHSQDSREKLAQSGRVRSGELDDGVFGIAILDKDEKTVRIGLYVDDQTGKCGLHLRDGKGRLGAQWVLSQDGGEGLFEIHDADPDHGDGNILLRHVRDEISAVGICDEHGTPVIFLEDQLGFADGFSSVGVSDGKTARAMMAIKSGKSGVAVFDKASRAVVKLTVADDGGTEVILPSGK